MRGDGGCRRGAKKRGTETTQALAHPDIDKTNNSTGDVTATPAVQKDGRNDAYENSRSEQSGVGFWAEDRQQPKANHHFLKFYTCPALPYMIL